MFTKNVLFLSYSGEACMVFSDSSISKIQLLISPFRLIAIFYKYMDYTRRMSLSIQNDSPWITILILFWYLTTGHINQITISTPRVGWSWTNEKFTIFTCNLASMHSYQQPDSWVFSLRYEMLCPLMLYTKTKRNYLQHSYSDFTSIDDNLPDIGHMISWTLWKTPRSYMLSLTASSLFFDRDLWKNILHLLSGGFPSPFIELIPAFRAALLFFASFNFLFQLI